MTLGTLRVAIMTTDTPVEKSAGAQPKPSGKRRSPYGSTGLANRTRSHLTPGLGRGLRARRFKELEDELTIFAGGDPDPIQLTRIRSAAQMRLGLEELEDASARGETVDAISYSQAASSYARMLDRIQELSPKPEVRSRSRSDLIGIKGFTT